MILCIVKKYLKAEKSKQKRRFLMLICGYLSNYSIEQLGATVFVRYLRDMPRKPSLKNIRNKA